MTLGFAKPEVFIPEGDTLSPRNAPVMPVRGSGDCQLALLVPSALSIQRQSILAGDQRASGFPLHTELRRGTPNVPGELLTTLAFCASSLWKMATSHGRQDVKWPRRFSNEALSHSTRQSTMTSRGAVSGQKGIRGEQ